MINDSKEKKEKKKKARNKYMTPQPPKNRSVV